ncbi:hypothetical protein MED222_05030 [Vibrio sp. MED222]|nr:hypothetical protein MED222_05030 [Vibrio sp. MED222]
MMMSFMIVPLIRYESSIVPSTRPVMTISTQLSNLTQTNDTYCIFTLLFKSMTHSTICC